MRITITHNNGKKTSHETKEKSLKAGTWAPAEVTATQSLNIMPVLLEQPVSTWNNIHSVINQWLTPTSFTFCRCILLTELSFQRSAIVFHEKLTQLPNNSWAPKMSLYTHQVSKVGFQVHAYHEWYPVLYVELYVVLSEGWWRHSRSFLQVCLLVCFS